MSDQMKHHDKFLANLPEPGELCSPEILDYLVDLINYKTKIIREYREGKRDKRNTPMQNQERLQENQAERDDIYYNDLCVAARQLGYEWLPFPAVPHWQAPDGRVLWLSYDPPPRSSHDT